MTVLSVEYVFRTEEGGWRVSGSRVSLDSVVYAHRDGHGPREIQSSFPTLSLEQIHGAIAFYLRNQTEIEAYLRGQECRWEAFRAKSERENGALLDRVRAARAR